MKFTFIQSDDKEEIVAYGKHKNDLINYVIGKIPKEEINPTAGDSENGENHYNKKRYDGKGKRYFGKNKRRNNNNSEN